MPSPRILSALFVVTLAGGAAVVSCSSSSSSNGGSAECNANPWSCPAGQTCWPSDQGGNFACLNSAVGKNKGDACVDSIGSPTCGDGMACYQALGASGGTCVPYCDNTKTGRGCSAGEVCQVVALALPGGGTSAPFSVCIGSAPPDAGTDTGAPDSGGGDLGIGGDTFTAD